MLRLTVGWRVPCMVSAVIYPAVLAAQVDEAGLGTESPAVRPGPAADHFPLPPGIAIKRVEIAQGRDTASARGSDERLVYSNTLGRTAINAGTGLIADDIVITGGPGCRLTRFEFLVGGRANPANPGGSFGVEYALYTVCPGAVTSATLPDRLIPGTSGSISFLDEGPYLVSVVIPSDVTVAVQPIMWFALKFSRTNAGPILGAPPTEGLSQDLYHYPGLSCEANQGDFPERPHASFYLEVWAVGESCPQTSIGYHAHREKNRTEAGFYNPGIGKWVVDDLTLQHPCRMVGYEVTISDTGTYNFEFRSACDSAALEGTQKSYFASTANNQTRNLVFMLDDPLDLPATVYFAGKISNAVGKILAGNAPIAGQSADQFGIQDGDEGPCVSLNAIAGRDNDALSVTILCEGPAPAGACCDPFLTECQGGKDHGARCSSSNDCTPPGTCESVCRQLPEANCWFPHEEGLSPAWREGVACEPDPFDVPCGTWACCTLDDFCEDLTANECAAKQPIQDNRDFQVGVYCDTPGQHCPLGDCAFAREGPGCYSYACETAVCSFDDWCCSVEWDAVCLRSYGAFQPFCNIEPRNETCHDSGLDQDGARPIYPNSSTVLNNTNAGDGSEPYGFACYDRIEPICLDPESHWPCEDDHDCDSGVTCGPGIPHPRSQGAGITWFRFTADSSSAFISTCNPESVVTDTLIQVYSTGGAPIVVCSSLVPIGCNDHSDNGQCAQVCLEGLIVGEEYYLKVAGATDADVGLIELTIETPCPDVAASWDAADAKPLAATAQPVFSFANRPSSEAWDQGEVPRDAYGPQNVVRPPGVLMHSGPWMRDGFASVQVNVDGLGYNIPGDAANEPSLAIDPTDANRAVIGWRQFDSVASDFRMAGWAYSHNAGRAWTFPGVIEPGIFRSDPVLDSGPNGEFYFYSLSCCFPGTLFTSLDGGLSWDEGTPGVGGDKPWMTVDKSRSTGRGNVYFGSTNPPSFARLTPPGVTTSFADSPRLPLGTLAVGLDGTLYVAGNRAVAPSRNAKNPGESPVAPHVVQPDWPSRRSNVEFMSSSGESPNPSGLLQQTWVATEPQGGVNAHRVCLLAGGDLQWPFEISVACSNDAGTTFRPPVRVNDDPIDSGAWHWFGTLSIAPTGRIDVVWNDTRNTGQARLSELFYSYSTDLGETWSPNIPVSPVFDTWIGWPGQQKIGDYYHAISDARGVSVAYAATFNGEQDIYFLRIEPQIDCNDNGVPDIVETDLSLADDCNDNAVPDTCERDFDGDGLIDGCDPDMDDDGVANEQDVCWLNEPSAPVAADGRPRADTDHNCYVDLGDHARFRNCMLGGRLGVPAPLDACLAAFDANDDDSIDLLDWAAFAGAFRASGP